MSQDAGGGPGADPLSAMRAAVIRGRPAEVLQESETVIATATDPAAVIEAVGIRAEVLARLGMAAAAFELLRSTRDRQKAAGRPGRAAQLSMAQAALAMATGDMAGAMSALIEAANGFEEAGQPADQVRAQLQLAVAHAMAGQPDQVRQLLPGCLAAAQQLGDPELLAEVRHQEGSFLAATGSDPVPALEDGLRAADGTANPMTQIQLRADLGSALARPDHERAVDLMSQAERLATPLDDPLAGANGLATAAQGWWALERIADGLRCMEGALERLRRADAWPLLGRLTVAFADMCTAAGRPDEAQHYIDAALAAGRQLSGPGGEAEAMVMLGQTATQRGDQLAAQRAFGDAVRRLQAAGLPVPPPLAAALSDPGRPA
jgi:tetratricopeptide (TPR) repeat protein